MVSIASRSDTQQQQSLGDPGYREMVQVEPCITPWEEPCQRLGKSSCLLLRCSVSARAHEHDRNCLANSIVICCRWHGLRDCNTAFPLKLARGFTKSLPQFFYTTTSSSMKSAKSFHPRSKRLVPHSQLTAEPFLALGPS